MSSIADTSHVLMAATTVCMATATAVVAPPAVVSSPAVMPTTTMMSTTPLKDCCSGCGSCVLLLLGALCCRSCKDSTTVT